MNQPLLLCDLHQGFIKQADPHLLDQLRELSVNDRPMTGLPNPQQAAVVARLLDVIDTDDSTIFTHADDFIKCFKLAHDYVVKHGALWPQTDTQPATVSLGTEHQVESRG